MASGTKKPIDLAERVANRRSRRSHAAAAEDAWRLARPFACRATKARQSARMVRALPQSGLYDRD